MTTPLNNSVTLTDPGEVLASVPHLLGFPPTDSLVLLTVHAETHSARFGVTMRVDLPAPEQRQALAEYLLSGPIRNQGADAVLLAVIGKQTHARLREETWSENTDEVSTRDYPANLPHRELIEILREWLWKAGVGLVHAVWTPEIRAGSPWMCYLEEDCSGEISDPQTSPVAAAMTAAGSVTFDSRQELQALVSAESAEEQARLSAKLDTLLEERDAAPRSPADVTRDVRTVFGAIKRTAEGASLTEDDHLQVLMALSDHRVRDLALSTALGELSRPAEHLWLTLVRKAPPPEVADVAALLAFSAYLRGEGALASAALERIEQTRPEHRLGILLRQAMDCGIPVADLAVVARDAAKDAHVMIEEDGAR